MILQLNLYIFPQLIHIVPLEFHLEVSSSLLSGHHEQSVPSPVKKIDGQEVVTEIKWWQTRPRNTAGIRSPQESCGDGNWRAGAQCWSGGNTRRQCHVGSPGTSTQNSCVRQRSQQLPHVPSPQHPLYYNTKVGLCAFSC